MIKIRLRDIILVLLTVLVVSFNYIPTWSADNSISVYINDSLVEFDQEPIIVNDYTLVPFRGIFEGLGMVVQWVPDEQRVTAQIDSKSITLFIDTPEMVVDGYRKQIPTAPIIYNNRTMVPLRAISEAIGGQVDWDGNTRTVRITADVTDLRDWEKRVLELTNSIRVENGLNELEWDDELVDIIRKHCEDMMNRDFMGHTTPDGIGSYDRLKASGYPFFSYGENVAAGQISPEAVVNAWMNSESHKVNILKPEVTKLGVGCVLGGRYGIYWGQLMVMPLTSDMVVY